MKLKVGREFEMVRGSGTDVEFLKVFFERKVLPGSNFWKLHVAV